LFCRKDIIGLNFLFANGKRSDQAFAGVAQNGEGVCLFEMIFESRTIQGFLGHFFQSTEMVLGDANTLGGGEVCAAVGTRNGCHQGSFN
jgi:hypothetical protein